MSDNARRRNLILVILLILLIVLVLLLTQCLPSKKTTTSEIASTPSTTAGSEDDATPPGDRPEEVLSPATIEVPAEVPAGAVFSVQWTGPDNQGDYVTIVLPEADATVFGDYRDTQEGKSLNLTAPIKPGTYEVRYLAGQSRTILGRATVEVLPVAALLEAPAEVVIGTKFSVSWLGPNNQGDYITIVPADFSDDRYGDYVNTSAGSTVSLTAPVTAGSAEVRYGTGQGRTVLARRPIQIIDAQVTLSASDESVAGSTIEVVWTGPDNAGDYITVVPADTPDGQYANYTNTATGSPLNLRMPMTEGRHEIRYMTGQKSKVLARREIKIVAADVKLSAPDKVAAGGEVVVIWTGPNQDGDYITLVPKGTPDGQYAAYQYTTAGSPLRVAAPKEAGPAEIRYMSGQGAKVLARIEITVER